MSNKQSFAQCPFEYGVPINPSSTQHRTVLNEATYLGKVFSDRRKDGTQILVKILKNSEASTTLLAHQVVKPSVATGRFNMDALLSTDTANAVLGVVEDGYVGGVPAGYWFRCVVDGDQDVNLTTANGAQATVAVGQIVEADAVDGTVRAQVTGTDTDASIRPAIENRIGRSYVATTNGAATQAGMTIKVKVQLLDF